MKRIVYSLFAIFILYTSCKKEDTVSPVITLMNFAENDTISNIFLIQANATDNEKVAKTELYINNVFIDEFTEMPFSYQWNTMDVDDGENTIKIIAYDGEGNKTESSSIVFVQNALLTFTLGDFYSGIFQIVVSDESGNILNSATLQKNESIKIMPLTPFEEDAINFIYCSDAYADFTILQGWVHVKRGSEFKMDPLIDTTVTVKRFKLNLINDVGSFSQLIISTDKARYILSSISDTINLPATIPYTTGHKLLLQLISNEGRFYKLSTIENVEELTENLSSITASQQMKSYSFPATGNLTYLLQARANGNEVWNEHYISQGYGEYNDDYLEIYYPDEYFSKYKTHIGYTPFNSHKSYSNNYLGEIPSSFIPIDADIDIVNSNANDFNANLSGIFDTYITQYYNTSQIISLQVFAPASQNKWKLPDMTSIFENSNLNLDNFILNQISFANFESLDWSNSYYDTSIDFEQLNTIENYVQYLFIEYPDN